MRNPRVWAVGCAVLAALAAVIAWTVPGLNGYRKHGRLQLGGLGAPVEVTRDEKAMAYIRAQTLLDGIEAQGFVTAQDRLFQMQLTRMLSQGRLSELIGEKGRAVDVRMRTIGMHRNALKHAKILDDRTRLFFQRYVDGVNWFINTCPDQLPLELKVAGIEPEPWTIADCLSIMYYMAWITSANAMSEILAQSLVDAAGPELAAELFSINLNPDDASDRTSLEPLMIDRQRLHVFKDPSLLEYWNSRPNGIGSNNWVVSSSKSASGKPIVANDPHLDARILPGVWYPCEIITPDFRAVGVIIPGIPGMVIGRTSHVAMGVTNAYGDCQDLYVETVDPQDPGRYMEGTSSIPFRIITQTLKIRDKGAPTGYRMEDFRIRFTKRGPVVSGILPGLGSDRVITLRWAASETMEPSIGLEAALTAKSVTDLRTALGNLNFIALNWVFADSAGNTGWHVSGKLPIRSQKDSTLPYRVRDGSDNWVGWIPFHEMPHAENPARGWIGTCNHKTTAADYPYYFSSYFSPSYRYRRLKELLDAPGSKSAPEHWQYARDTMNVMARTIAPVMARALLSGEGTREMGTILEKWDFRDEPGTAAATIFQLLYRNFVRSVLDANLGAEIASLVLGEGYFWEERFQRMVEKGSSPWLEKALKVRNASSMDDLFRRVGRETAEELSDMLGKDPSSWLWGRAHTLQFVHPLRRNGVGMSLLGAGPYPMGGSRETLYCAWYDFNNPFSVVLSASLRMVADLGDEEKVMAVIPGGVSGRTLDVHMKDQIPAYMDGTPVYWWFSDEAIRTHGKHVLTLVPKHTMAQTP